MVRLNTSTPEDRGSRRSPQAQGERGFPLRRISSKTAPPSRRRRTKRSPPSVSGRICRSGPSTRWSKNRSRCTCARRTGYGGRGPRSSHEVSYAAPPDRRQAGWMILLLSRPLRPVDDHRLSDDIFFRQITPRSAVVAVRRVVAHDEEVALLDSVRFRRIPVDQDAPDRVALDVVPFLPYHIFPLRIVQLRQPEGISLCRHEDGAEVLDVAARRRSNPLREPDRIVVDIAHSPPDLDFVAPEGDTPLDEIDGTPCFISFLRKPKHDHVSPSDAS